MNRREKLLLAGKIYMMKDFFDFHSENEKDVDAAVIEIIEETGDEFEHHDDDRVNQLVFEPDSVYISNPKQYVFIPDLFIDYLKVSEKGTGKKRTFEIELNGTKPAEFMEAFQIAYNRMKYEESHSQNSPKEFEDKLVNEMKAFE